VNLPVTIPPESFEAIAQRAAAIARELDREENPPSPYVSIEKAAEFLCCKTKRIYDLRSSGRLRRFSEGGRALVLREELERLVVDEDALPTLAVRRRVA